MTASALSLAQTPLYEEKFVPALAMIATMRQNIENAIFFIVNSVNLFYSCKFSKNRRDTDDYPRKLRKQNQNFSPNPIIQSFKSMAPTRKESN